MFALLLLGFHSPQAQTEYRLNVKEAVSLALKNVTDIKNLRIDSLKQEAQIKEIVGSALPQVSGSAQVAHYLTLPKILFPSTGRTDIYNVLNEEGIKDGQGIPIEKKDNKQTAVPDKEKRQGGGGFSRTDNRGRGGPARRDHRGGGGHREDKLIDEKEIQKKIQETQAKLSGGGGKGKGAV